MPLSLRIDKVMLAYWFRIVFLCIWFVTGGKYGVGGLGSGLAALQLFLCARERFVTFMGYCSMG